MEAGPSASARSHGWGHPADDRSDHDPTPQRGRPRRHVRCLRAAPTASPERCPGCVRSAEQACDSERLTRQEFASQSEKTGVSQSACSTRVMLGKLACHSDCQWPGSELCQPGRMRTSKSRRSRIECPATVRSCPALSRRSAVYTSADPSQVERWATPRTRRALWRLPTLKKGKRSPGLPIPFLGFATADAVERHFVLAIIFRRPIVAKSRAILN